MYRNSEGSLRRQVRFQIDEGEFNLVTLFLAASGDGYILDSTTATAFKAIAQKSDSTNTKFTFGWTFPGSSVKEIGRETVMGFGCRHFRTKAGSGDTESQLDIWISDDLQAVLLEQGDGPYETYRWRMFDIERKEPDSSLFRIPPDYRVVDLPRGMTLPFQSTRPPGR
jgi:hypothetical protein